LGLIRNGPFGLLQLENALSIGGEAAGDAAERDQTLTSADEAFAISAVATPA
jgi:hypothetical protein